MAASSRCSQNLKYENFTSSFGRLRQNIAPKACRTCSTIIFLYSTNQIIDLWRCRWRCRRQILNSLLASLRSLLQLLQRKPYFALSVLNSSHSIGTNCFHINEENERYTATGSRCRQNLKFKIFKLPFDIPREKNCSRRRAARAARLFFLIQPITSLICAILLSVSLNASQTP